MPNRTVHFTRSIALLLVACLIVAAAGVTVAQQVRKTRTAQVRADSLEYDWSTNTTVMEGECRLTIENSSDAVMTAPKMTIKFNDDHDRINSLDAGGPVHFTVTTAADEQGVHRKITATANGGATYSEQNQQVRLTGGASADLATLGADAEAVHFEGDTITANLKTSRLQVDNAHLKIETPLDED